MAVKHTYQLGRCCLFCEQPIPDKHPTEMCCGHRTPTTVVQVATGYYPDQPLEVLELTHTKVLGSGQRRWVGRGEDGRRVVWDETAA